MKQVGIRVDSEIADAFYRFCRRLGMRPSVLLTSIIDFYGRSEILAERFERHQITKAETLVELGQIIADMQKLSQANGEFKRAVGDLLEPHGIHVEELGSL